MDSIKEIARALGSRGGRERAARLSPERRHEIAAMGGKAAAIKRMSADYRRMMAEDAAGPRWDIEAADERIMENARRLDVILSLAPYRIP